MGLVERISNLVKANLNDFLERQQDPEEMLRNLISDMEEDLSEAIIQIKQSKIDSDRFEGQYRNTIKEISILEEKAEWAVGNGKDDLAREVLTRKQKAEHNAREAKVAWDECLESIDNLETSLKPFQDKLENTRVELKRLVRKKENAKVEKNVQTALGKVSTADSEPATDKLEEEVQETKSEAEAMREMQANESLFNGWNVEESEKAVEEELENLKKKLKKGKKK